MTKTELRRSLGATSAVMITVGSIIGSGVFFKPLDISRSLPDPTWIYAGWIVIGVVCLCGAIAFAELGAMLPEAGGQYTFLREGFGRLPAFLYGWCFLLIINTGSVAALSVVFASSLATLIPGLAESQSVVAAAMILVLALANHFGVRWGALIQNLSGFAKLGALAAIVLAGFALGGDLVAVPPSAGSVTVPPPTPGLLPGLAAAAVALFWAYEGWHMLPFSAAEMLRPQRDLPRGLIFGVLIVIVTYVAVNAVFLQIVPQEEMRTLASEVEVPRLVLTRIFGAGAASWLTVLICISVFGAANPNLMSGPRAFYAMAQDGLMPRVMMRVHKVYQTPAVSIWFQALWSIVLVFLLQTFRNLTEYVVFAGLLFYALAVGAVYVLRRREPDRERPYRCLGYPFTPAVFIAAALLVNGYTLLDPEARSNALIGLVILAAGLPVYFLMERRAARQAHGLSARE